MPVLLLRAPVVQLHGLVAVKQVDRSSRDDCSQMLANGRRVALLQRVCAAALL